jgi:hypothetical protein
MGFRKQKLISRKHLIVLPNEFVKENQLSPKDIILVWTGQSFMVVLPGKKEDTITDLQEVLLDCLIMNEPKGINIIEKIKTILKDDELMDFHNRFSSSKEVGTS